MSQKEKTNTTWYYLCGESKEQNSERQRVEWWLPGAGKWKKQGDAGQRVPTSGYKMNDLWGSNVERDDYGQ